MKPYPFFAVLLVLMAGCSKNLGEETPKEEPSGEPNMVYLAIAVDRPSMVEQVSNAEFFDFEVPFNNMDQLVVTGNGISGILRYDRFYIYPGGKTAFSGYLKYEGTGEPPKNLVLDLKLINPSFGNNGDLQGPAAAGNLEEAVHRYGVYTGTCTFGNPTVELTQSTAFYQLDMDFLDSFPGENKTVFHLLNDGKTLGPFEMDICYHVGTLVLAFPGGYKLDRPLLDLKGIARFPLVLPFYPATQDSYVLDGGRLYSDSMLAFDMSAERTARAMIERKILVYQTDPQTTSSNDVVYAWGDVSCVFLSNINIESGGQNPIFISGASLVWVDGDCKAISTSSSVSVMDVRTASSIHIRGDGNLIVENRGKGDDIGEGGAGLSFGNTGSCGDLIIEDAVSIYARGAAGAAGIGTGEIYMHTEKYDCGNILINTTGTVTAIGGAGAAGIGAGRKGKTECTIKAGRIEISGGVVDAAGGGGGAFDIGFPEMAEVSDGVSVNERVTYDGVHGYRVAGTKGGITIGYNKSTD